MSVRLHVGKTHIAEGNPDNSGKLLEFAQSCYEEGDVPRDRPTGGTLVVAWGSEVPLLWGFFNVSRAQASFGSGENQMCAWDPSDFQRAILLFEILTKRDGVNCSIFSKLPDEKSRAA